MMKWFLRGVLPITFLAFVLYTFKTVYVVDGSVDVFRLWMLLGIPFGITRMLIWFVPSHMDTGASMGVLALNIMIAGVLGGFIAAFTILEGAFYLVIYPIMKAVFLIVGK